MTCKPPKYRTSCSRPNKKFPDLKSIVDDFINNRRDDLKDELDHFACKKGNMDECLQRSTQSLLPSGCMHDHQRRIGTKRLKIFEGKLKRHLNKIKAAESFQTIHKILTTIANDLDGIGPLTVYDVSIRLAHRKGLLPQKVYLQCGALVGARSLLRGAKVNSRMKLADFPSEFHSLNTVELETCLCIYKKEIKQIIG